MPIVVNSPATFVKGADNIIKISREGVLGIPKVSADIYYSDISNWKEICFNFIANPENEIEVVKFKASQPEPEAVFSVSIRASNSWVLGSIVIHDFDGGRLPIFANEFPEDASLDFNLQFPVETPVSPVLSVVSGVSNSLSWTPLSSIPDYQIWKKTGAGAFVLIESGHDTNSYIDTSVVNGTSYSYYVVLEFDELFYQSNTVVV